MREEKLRLRKQIIEHMNSLSKERYTTLSEQIAFSLYAQKEWTEAKTIGITLSMENEVNTYLLSKKLGKKERKLLFRSVIKKQEQCPLGKLVILINWKQCI